MTWFVCVLGINAAMRLGEVVVSWRRLRTRSAAPEPGVFPAMVLLHTAFVTLPVVEVLWLDRPFVPLLAAAATVVWLSASALRIWTLGTIGPAWNVRVVTPDDDAIATTGPYRWIRHPNYLCVVLELAAVPLLHTAVISALALGFWNALVLRHRIRTEEAVLLRIPRWREAFADRARLLPYIY